MNLRLIPMLLACAWVTACAASRERDAIRHGLLTTDIRQQAFLSVWGAPTRTSAVHSTGNEEIKAGFGFFFQGREQETYEICNYESRRTVLVFDDHALVAWSTPETVQELAAPK